MHGDEDRVPADLLQPALTAAMRALTRMEDDEIPAQLRALAGRSVHRALPPPLATKLREWLDRESWLRQRAADELGAGSGEAHEASQLYLTRPDGWEGQVAALVDQRRTRSAAYDVEALRRENRRLERLVDELTQRVDAAERELADQRRAVADEVERAVESTRRRLESAQRALEQQEREADDLAADHARLTREMEEADERIATLRGRLTPSIDRPGFVSPSQPVAFGRGAPMETARLLDALVEATRPRAAPEAVPGMSRELSLPPGVRPDDTSAIEWLLEPGPPTLLVVDGHNVAHDLDPAPGRAARDRVVMGAARLRRLSDRPLSVVVFFDTSHEPDVHVSDRVSVRYVTDADDAIEQAVRAATLGCVVVSTDRDVRRRAREAGAVALWGTAFSAWLTRR